MNGRAAAAEPAAAQRQETLGALPEWDLSDLYPGPESEPLAHDFSALTEDAEAFRGRYEGRLAALPGPSSARRSRPMSGSRKRSAGS